MTWVLIGIIIFLYLVIGVGVTFVMNLSNSIGIWSSSSPPISMMIATTVFWLPLVIIGITLYVFECLNDR